jgi:phenylacetate-CoA ligase
MLPIAPEDPIREPHPGLSPAGAALLQWMREHPAAPRFSAVSGHRLKPEEIAEVRAEHEAIRAARIDPRARAAGWLPDWLARVLRVVPAYRDYGPPPADLAVLPTTCRSDFAAAIARYVPDDLALDRLIGYRTSGTTGEPLQIPSHPRVAARYLGHHLRALDACGVRLTAGAGAVGVLLIGWQRRCFTYVSVTPSMGESGLIKLNLHPDDWRDPADRGRYLDAMAPEVLSGDPISLEQLLAIDFAHRPRAIFSTAMQLTPALRAELQARFDCPVLDFYSLNEAGPIAVADPDGQGHRLLQPRLIVEIVDAAGRPVPDGEVGEVTLTGGFNDWLPLLRYRTGDHAALVCRDGIWRLTDLSGRAPVRFRTASGHWLNNVDITHALAGLPLRRYQLLQRADGGLALALSPYADPLAEAATRALAALFGDTPIRCAPLLPSAAGPKPAQYRSELVCPGNSASVAPMPRCSASL